METLPAERPGYALQAVRAGSPLAFLAIHTPTEFQNENGLKPKKSADRVSPAV